VEQKENILLLLWRTWTVHNYITHNSGSPGLTESVHALLSLKMSLDDCRHPSGEDGKKGKGPSRTETTRGKQMRMRVPETWVRPPDGWVKLNVDASFVAATGCAGTGVVARDSTGKIKLTAWRALFNCSSAVEAEAQA